MRRYLLRLMAILLAVAIGAIGLTSVGAAADDSYMAVMRHAAQQGKHVEAYEFSRTAAVVTPDGADAAAVTCYGGAIWQYTSVSPTTLPNPSAAAFTTTDRCLDINMRKSTAVTWDVQACVIFVDHTPNCNYWTDISSSWKTIATNVADNSHFRVMVIFDWPNASGTTAIQLAF